MATLSSRLGLLLPEGDDLAVDAVTGAPSALNANFGILDTAVGGTVYNVRHFGAAGDGTTDDTTAIQAALDASYAAGRGLVVIPPGSYRLTTYLTVRSYTTISAYGAYLFGQGTHSLLRNFTLLGTPDSFPGYTGNSYITIMGGIWDNRGQLAGSDVKNNCITFNHGRRITCRDMTVRNVASYHGIEMNSIDGGRVLNCRAEGFVDNSALGNRTHSEAFQIDVAASGSSTIGLWDNTPSRDILIQGCSAGPAVDGSGLGTWGALAGSHTTPIGGFYDHIRIIGNSMINGALLYGVHAQGWRDSVIADNVFASPGASGVYAEGGSTGVIIANNVIRSSGSNAIRSDHIGVIIEGNQIIGTVTNHGIFTDTAVGNIIRNNRIESAFSAAIRLANASTNCFCGGNKIVRNGITVNGFSLSNPATNCIIVGNDMRGQGFTNTTWVNSGTTAAPVITHAGAVLPNPSVGAGDNWI